MNSFDLEAWANRPPPELRIVPVESMYAYPDLPYDFSRCPVIYYPFHNRYLYMISERNQPEASRAILGLNELLDMAPDIEPRFPPCYLSKRHLRFYPSEALGLEGDDFSFFEINPRTKTGKLTKHPLLMRVQTLSHDEAYEASQDPDAVRIHGSITYLATGEIGKASVACWQGRNGYAVEWKYGNPEPMVRQIGFP